MDTQTSFFTVPCRSFQSSSAILGFSMKQIIFYPKIKSDFIPGKLIVTEKIHGSNIGIGYVDGAFHIQSRKKVIDQKCNQFGLPHIIKCLSKIVERIKSDPLCLCNNFLVYGEIFGLKNQRPEICYNDSVASERAFQCTDVFFRAFDFCDVDQKVIWKYSDAVQLFERVQMPYVPILDIRYETLSDLQDIVQKYKSAYSEQSVEGFVLKKDEPEPLSQKRKNAFKVKRQELDAKSLAKQWLGQFPFDAFVNEDRFNSAFSKIGEHRWEIQEEMVRDTLEEITNFLVNKIRLNVGRFMKDYDTYIKRIRGDTVVTIEEGDPSIEENPPETRQEHVELNEVVIV